MPDFTRPEYASYVELCGSLRLEREYGRGDWYRRGNWWTITREDGTLSHTLWAQWEDGESPDPARSGHWYGVRSTIWLPQLADWLDILEESGHSDVYLHAGWDDPWRFEAHCCADYGDWLHASGEADTREEAAARLAIAVGAVKEPAQP